MSNVRALADEYWRYVHATDHLENLYVGDLEYIEAWPDLSPAGQSAWVDGLSDYAARARAMAAGGTDGVDDAATLATVRFTATAIAAINRWAHLMGLTSGVINLAVYLEIFLPRYGLVTAEHGDRYLEKLARFPECADGVIESIRASVAAGRTPPRRGVAAAIEDYGRLLATPLADSPLASQPAPRELGGSAKENWHEAVAEAVHVHVLPALARLRKAHVEDLLPSGRDDDRPGVCHFADGERDYADIVRAYTSTPHSPDEIHRLGLERIAMLEEEYVREAGAMLGASSATDIYERLRNDASLRYEDAASIVHDAETALARANDAAAGWFGRLPVTPCAATAVDAGAVAYYAPPDDDLSRPGEFFFRVSDPAAWPRYELECITFHEAVPGHHLQLTLALESDLPPVQRRTLVAGYAEGWGLYTERLADEMGLYSSNLARIGMLSCDSLRASRLVVDTGLHAMGWSRQQAIDYVLAHSPMSSEHVAEEIDRYIAEPGQATCYMIGRIAIEAMRRRAEQTLGDNFDIRGFHDAVLGSGSVPFDALEQIVDHWIAENDLTSRQ
jgi:uncharacterized protein (DUF885 family)